MKFALACFLTTSFFFTLSAQEGTHAVKRYSKVIDDFRYLVTAYVFEDGHVENYISRLSLKTSLKEVNSKDYNRFTKNIEWDESNEVSGLQMTMRNESVIENAFNNAFRQAEAQKEIPSHSFGSITLDSKFLKMGKKEQSIVLLQQINDAFTKHEGRATPPDAQEEEKDDSEIFAFFVSNEVNDIPHANVRAIYNWIFADAYGSWTIQKKLMNANMIARLKEAEAKPIYDEKNNNKFDISKIINNPTLKIKNSIAYQVADQLPGSTE